MRPFFILGGTMGVFFGPAQAASRSLMGWPAPNGQEVEMFELYAFAGRSSAFLGLWLYSVVVFAAGHRWAMAKVIPFLFVGAVILLTVDEKPSDADSAGRRQTSNKDASANEPTNDFKAKRL